MIMDLIMDPAARSIMAAIMVPGAAVGPEAIAARPMVRNGSNQLAQEV
jgi:hypothetical protein